METCREVQAAAASALAIVAVIQPVNVIVCIGDGVFQGASDFTYLAAAMAVACSAAAAAMVSGQGGLVDVWWALFLLQGLRAAAIAARYADRVPLFGTSPLRLPPVNGP